MSRISFELRFLWKLVKGFPKLYPSILLVYRKKGFKGLVGKFFNYRGALKNAESKDPKYFEIFTQRYEAVSKTSPQCIASGKCVVCGCDVPEKFYEPDACEKGCYEKIQ